MKSSVSRMTALSLVVATGASFAVPFELACRFGPQVARAGYLGFDRNDYPGDANLTVLRRTFSYSGYWLNNPPGGNTNSWAGKRKTLQAAGFGFLVVFSGRTDTQIKAAGDADKLGASDAAAAVSAARREGFPSGTTIFLDQEEGGRLLPEQRSYLHSWVDGVNSEGFQAGVYCSASLPRKPQAPLWLQRTISGKTQAEGNCTIGWPTTRVRRHQDAHSREMRPQPHPVVSRLRKSGNSLSHRVDLISQAVASTITARMEIAIRRAWIPPKDYTWT